ncbi:MAG TPA: subclass B3 metallo-beta-lactamase [Chitinophagaceae bacterium]|nr:subclass B3 metallo-beta-lactamase [Chitinophagaceae bacterium]
MKRFILPLTGFLLCFLLDSSWPALAQQDPDDRKMNGPMEPFRIMGNLYYVGASDVTAYLITGPRGHILIDGGYRETASRILANIRKLGFRPRDVRILLINHAHYDHCGGLAQIKRVTHARLLASPGDAPVLEDGGKSDFYFGSRGKLFPPVHVDSLLQDGQVIRLGPLALTTYFTPGHTRGATSWEFSLTDSGRTYQVVIASSLTTLDYALTGQEAYPHIAADFRQSFTTLDRIHPDIFLASHGQFFDLLRRARDLRAGVRPNPFIDPEGLARYVQAMREDFDKRWKADRP